MQRRDMEIYITMKRFYVFDIVSDVHVSQDEEAKRPTNIYGEQVILCSCIDEIGQKVVLECDFQNYLYLRPIIRAVDDYIIEGDQDQLLDYCHGDKEDKHK